MMQKTPRLAWAKMNADGMLLAALAFISSLDLFHPTASDLAQVAGYVPMSFYLWTACYLVAGCTLTGAFFVAPARWRMPLEMSGRLLLCAGFALETWRTGTIIGWTAPHMVESYFLAAVLFLTSAWRASLLLSRDGVVVVIGGRFKP